MLRLLASAKIIPYACSRPNDVRKYGTAHVRKSTAGAGAALQLERREDLHA